MVRPPAPTSIPAGNYFSGQATAAPHPSLKACLSARRGAVHWVEKPGWPERTGPGEPHLLPLSSTPGLDLGSLTPRTTSLTHSPSTVPCLPQTFLGLWVFHPGQSSKTMRVSTLSAPGTGLTHNCSGKQPQAGLGRGRKGEGELQQTRRETKASSGANSLAAGWVPRLEGPARAGLPEERSGWHLLSQCVSSAGSWPPAGTVCGARDTES